MSDYDYEQNNVVDAPVQETVDQVVTDLPPVQVVTTEGYDIKDGAEVIAARDMSGAVNYDLIILIILVVAIVGGAIFFAFKQRQGHQQVPTSEPADGNEDQLTEVKVGEEEKVVDTQEQL